MLLYLSCKYWPAQDQCGTLVLIGRFSQVMVELSTGSRCFALLSPRIRCSFTRLLTCWASCSHCGNLCHFLLLSPSCGKRKPPYFPQTYFISTPFRVQLGECKQPIFQTFFLFSLSVFFLLLLCVCMYRLREQDVGGCFQTPHKASSSSLSSYCMSKSAEHCVEHAEEVEMRLELFHSLMRLAKACGVSPSLNLLLPRRERAQKAASSRWKSHRRSRCCWGCCFALIGFWHCFFPWGCYSCGCFSLLLIALKCCCAAKMTKV